MRKPPLSYYVKITITEDCISYYMGSSKKNLNEVYSYFNYVKTYIKSNSDMPPKVKMLITLLINSLGTNYGFNSEKAIEYIVRYFGSEYKNYLDYIIFRDSYLNKKQLNYDTRNYK